VSNAIRFDSLLVHYLARELDERLRARRLRGVRLDPDALRFTLELDRERLVWELHPTRGWIRRVEDPAADAVPEAIEGWGGRRVPTQRRPRVRRVHALPDERWLEIEIDAGGPDRASRFVVELMTNQWNVLALTPDRTILSALRSRAAGGRSLRAGTQYQPPGTAGRVPRDGLDRPVSPERWKELLADVPPADRATVMVRALAWVSPLNAPFILGTGTDPAIDTGAGTGTEAAIDTESGGGTDPGTAAGGRLRSAWERYRHLAERPDPQPQVLALDRPTPYPVPLPGVKGQAVACLLDAFDRAASDAGVAVLAPEVRVALEERVERTRIRATRMRSEAAEAPGKAAALRRHADLLMAQLHRVRKGEREATLDDFEGGSVTVELDPALTPVDNARSLYDRARKRDRAAERLPVRVRAALAELHRLEDLLEAMKEGRADPAAVAAAVADVRPREGGATGGESRVPYRRYRSSGGLEIRVGRAGRSNDDLTFRHASPDDIWLHARDVAGAHVILRWADRDRNPPRADLVEAAVLAALNSRARTSGTVPVDWTRRKHVRKPRKAPPGAVIPDRVATLFVEPDPTLPERLEHP
jgi:predicted ribosome quality control (RQC) complex YloA/Tae2 family protein